MKYLKEYFKNILVLKSSDNNHKTVTVNLHGEKKHRNISNLSKGMLMNLDINCI